MNDSLIANFNRAKFNPEAFNVGPTVNSYLADTLSTSNIPSQIFTNLDDINDIFNLQLVCKRFYNAADENDVLLGKNQWQRISFSFEDLNINTKKGYIFSFLSNKKQKNARGPVLKTVIKLRKTYISPIEDSYKIKDICKIKEIYCQFDKMCLAYSVRRNIVGPKTIVDPKNLDELFAIDLDKIILDSVSITENLLNCIFWQNRFTSIPSEIKYFTVLTELDLHDNFLEYLPTQISCLTNLTKINLIDNRFSSFPKILFTLNNSLKELKFSNNYLESLPEEFCSLTNLETLELDSNQLCALPIKFDKLSSLTHLNLNINKLKSVPIEIGNLCNLRALGLSQNNLKTLPHQLLNLTNLRKIDFSNNDLEVFPTEIFARKDVEIIYTGNPLNLDCRSIIAEKTDDYWNFYFQTLLNPQIIYDKFQKSIVLSLDYSFFGTKF